MLGRCAAHASRNSHYQKHAFLLILVLPLNANPRSVGKNDVAQPIDGDDQQALDSGKSRGERGWVVEICFNLRGEATQFLRAAAGCGDIGIAGFHEQLHNTAAQMPGKEGGREQGLT